MDNIKRYAIAALLGGVFLKVASKQAPKKIGKIMPKMMEGMMGEGGPMDMWRKVMEGFVEARKLGAFATPELRTLFEEWIKETDKAVLDFVGQATNTDPEKVAQHLKLSKESAIFFLGKLAQEGKVKIGAVSLA